MSELCRPEMVEVDGEQVPVVVRGNRPLTDADRAALAELVKATLKHARSHETARQRVINVLDEHRHEGALCSCGNGFAYSLGTRRHAVHVTNELAKAGVLRDLYADVDGPEVRYGVGPEAIPPGAVLTAQALWDAIRDEFDPNDVWTYDEIGPLLRTFVSVLATRPDFPIGGAQ